MFKKLIAFIAIIIILLFTLTYALAFTSAGNEISRPIIEKYIQENYSKDLVLKDFKLNNDKINATLIYKDLMQFDIKGNFSLLNQELDLKVFFKSISFRNKINGLALIRGKFKDFKLDLRTNFGEGETIILSNIVNFDLMDLSLKSRRIKTNSFANILPLDPFINGDLNIDLDIKQTNSVINGNLFIKIFKGNLKSSKIFKEIAQSNIKGEISGPIINSKLVANGVLKSPLYELVLSKIHGDLENLSLDYEITIPSVKALNNLAKNDFLIFGSGKFSTNFKDKKLLDFATISFDGLNEISLDNDNLKINFQQNNLIKLANFLKFPDNFSGQIDGNLNYFLQNKTGNFSGEILDFKMKKNEFFNLINQYSDFDVTKENFPKNPLEMHFNKDNVTFSTVIRNDNFNIKTSNATYSMENQNISLPLILGIGSSEIKFNLSGKINSPKINFELRNILKLDRLR